MILRLAHAAGHSFLAAPLGPDSVVLDFGLNTGCFARAIAKRLGCRIVGVEPVAALHAAFADVPRLEAHRAAIGGADGAVEINVYAAACATSLHRAQAKPDHSETVPKWSLRSAFNCADAPRIDLVKVDIEGEECPMFEEASDDDIRHADQYTVEFHDWIWPDHLPRVEAIKSQMRGLGYRVLTMSMTNGDILFVRDHLLDPVSWAYLTGPYKYANGIGRKLKRLAALS